MPQAHGGALKPGGTLEGRSRGGLVAAERRRARADRDEAIDDAVTGHIEKLSAIMGQLVDEAGGEQYRCTCGVLGPKVSKMAAVGFVGGRPASHHSSGPRHGAAPPTPHPLPGLPD